MTKQFAAPASRALRAGVPVSSHTFDDRSSSSRRQATRWNLSWGQSAVAFVAAILLAGAINASAQAPTLQPNWSQLSPATSPPVRYIHALTYDPAIGQTVLFGGFGEAGFLNDTWLWNGTTWTQQTPPNSPPARGAHAMVYDATHNQVVVFGGFNSTNQRLGDTWLWNGTTWTQASPSASPSPRDAAVMVYDPATNNVLLFGGSSEAAPSAQGDTWTWDGTNWTQLSPASSPSARDDYSMVYDAATGLVVLFGGVDASGNYLNDTWTWDGSTWTHVVPATSPSVRYGQGMAYDAALGEVILFGGQNSTGYLNDTWVWNGTTWAEQSTSPAALYARDVPNAVTYDAAQGQAILFGGFSSGSSTTSLYNDTWAAQPPQNFGNINVCSPTQSPTPSCTNQLTLTYNVPLATTFGTPKVVVQGAASNDFTLAANGCLGAVIADGTCTETVTFTPQAPGLRAGAVELFDTSNPANLLASTPIFGVGEGPELVYGPTMNGAAILPGPSLENVVSTTPYPLGGPRALATDAAGDLFIPDAANQRVVEVAANGTATTVGVGLVAPQAVAVDGAGNLYIADTGLNSPDGEVLEVPAGCTVSGCQIPVYAPTVHPSPVGVAVDGLGDLFISDDQVGVIEIPANGSGQTTVYNPGGASSLNGIAVDAAGDLFITDSGLHQVVEIPAGCNASGCQVQINAGNWIYPQSVAVDAAGDLYVSDSGLQTGGEVLEIPAGCASNSCEVPLFYGISFGVAVDAAGEVYIAEYSNDQVLKVNSSQMPTETFGSEADGMVSSPLSFTILNAGNQTLISSGMAFPYFWYQVDLGGNPPDCSTTFSLAPGQGCNFSEVFTAKDGGPGLWGSAIWIYDNNLNGSSSTQQNLVDVYGTIPAVNYTLTVTEAGGGSGTVIDNVDLITCTETNGSITNAQCSASYAGGSSVTLTATPAAGSTFGSWGGACVSAGTNPQCVVTVNSALNVSASFASGDFATANVCPSGPSSPSCASAFPVTVSYSGSTTVSSAQAVTEGITGLDFAANLVTCGGGSCTASVTFKPLAAGLRIGAVELLDSGNNVLATQPISGIGQGAVAAFSPLGVFGRYLGGPNGNCGQPGQSACVPLNAPKGVAVNATGANETSDIYYIADTGNSQVLELQGNNTNPVYSGGPGSAPQGVVVDGAGDLFVADEGLGEVVEIPAGCTGCQNVQYGPYGSGELIGGLAVDGAGDVFVPDATQHWVLEITPAGGYPPSVGSGWVSPAGAAVDAAGDLFVADYGIPAVVEVPAGCNSASCQNTIGSGWVSPQSVAVDAAGDVYVSDIGQHAIVEVPAGCTSPSCQITVASGVTSYGVTVDPTGVVSYVDINAVGLYQVLQQFYGFGFSPSLVGNVSGDSPKSVTLQNVGNQTLSATGPGLLFTDPDFYQTPGSGTPADCTTTFSLTAGATCNVSVDFDPLSGGMLAGNVNFYDNGLNNTPYSQSFSLSGTGVPGSGSNFLTVTESGSGSGSVTSGDGLIGCNEATGSVTGTCIAAYSSGTATLTAAASSGSAFTGWGGACSSFASSLTCTVPMSSAQNVSANFAPSASFGSVSVCPGGSISGCTGSTIPVTFNFTGNTAVSQIQALTQGITGLDFSAPNSGQCINSFSAGNSCTVNVTFTPTAPGLRMGAVNLLDNSGNVLATQFVSGIGQGPAAAFGPGVQTDVGSGLNQPQGVAVDAAGDVFISNYGLGTVLKVTPGGVQTTVPAVGLVNPYGVAVDGAGDVFIADPNNSRVVKVAPSGAQTTVGSVANPYGVAVDGAGDVFIVDSQNTDVVKVTPSGVQTTVPASGLTNPYDVAVDGAGDVFISDPTNVQVVKVTPSGVQTTVSASGLVCPYGVAVDAAGDVIIADPCLAQVVEVSPSGVQTTIAASGLTNPISVAVDGLGDVFTGNSGVLGVVTEVQRSTPFVNLGIVSQNYQSSDTLISLQNIGNQTLTGSVGAVSGSYLFEDASTSNCTNGGGFSLSPGASCVENFYANTPSVGSISGTAVVTDNALSGTPATQTISISGLSLGPAVSFNATIGGTGTGYIVSSPTGINCGTGGSPGTCSASFSTGLTISLEEIPTGGSTFAGWGGACLGAGTSQFCSVNLIAAASVAANFTSSLGTDTVAVTELGSGAGSVTSTPSGISCSQAAGGASSGTCGGSFGAGSQVTLTANPAAGSAFLGWGAPCSGASLTCTFTVSASVDVGASFALQNFGSNVNVCPTGSSTPAPCSSSQTVTFSLAATTNIGAIQVVTQGTNGLDFALGSGSTCTGTISAGSFCGVNVTFTPLAPGLRAGAVELFDTGGNLVATTPVYGIGQGPMAAFNPATQATINTGSVSLSQPKGMLVDAAGNLFISDTTNKEVVKIAANGTETVFGPGLPTPLQFPQGMAEDGAGNLFIADNNLNGVVEIPAGCNSACAQEQIVPNPLNLSSQLGVAVDGAGNLFVGDFEGNEVAEVPANGGAQTLVYNPTPGSCTTAHTTPCSHPVDLTTDAAGDLFVADFGLQSVVEVPAGCTSAGCQKSIGVGWSQPDGVAVDAAGDVFVADAGLNEVVEVPAGCTTSACQMVMVSGINAVAVKLDSAGDLFVDNLAASQIVELTRSLPPSLSFAVTNAGNTSADSPQAVIVQNVGNQALTGSVGATSTTSFAENHASTCGTFSLAPGGLCSEGFSFTPQGSGILNDSAIFSDNTLNLASSVALQTVNLSGIGSVNGQTGTAVPNVVGMPEAAAATAITDAGLTLGTVNSQYSNSQPAGSVIGESPAAGVPVNLGSPVALLISTGQAPAPTPNPLTFENNYFVTGDFATAGVSLRGAGSGGVATKTINIPDSTSVGTQGVPDGADIVDGFLYWETLENTATSSGNTGTFLGYAITGQQIGNDLPYTDSGLSGTLRVYRADVNAYFQVVPSWNGARLASGPFTITLPDSGQTGSSGKFPLNEGASLVVIYRALSTTVPLKSVVIYDGSAIPTSSTTQSVQGFYDAVGGSTPGEVATLYSAGGNWNSSATPVTSLPADASQYTLNLNSGSAYAAVIFSTPVANSDNDGILNAWKSGPPAGDFFAGQPGYYDVKTQSWVPLPGAKHGQKDLFVQLDWMCGAVLANGQCDPAQENLFPSPDPDGKDPLVMVQQAFASTGITLHLEIGNAVPESTCTDSAGQLCQFPGEPGVIGWKNTLEFSKLWPRNFTSCAGGGDCTARFPFGQKDSYHYVLFGHSLAIPAWNTRFGTLSAITANSSTGQTTVTTANRGAQGSINYCPSRFTISGIISNPSLNGVYSTVSCPDAQTIILSTPGVANWSYSFATNTPPEPEIGLTSGTVTSISGYSDLGGADSAVTLALWETAPNQDMSKRAQVVAGTLFHEIGHTLGLGHGGLYYNGGAGSFVPTFDVNCKPNYQSSMNYLFQLDGVGPNAAVAYSNQTLESLTESSLSGVTSLVDINSNPATFSTTSWYSDVAPSSTASPATLHCDGTPLNGDTGYRVNGSIAPPTPAWSSAADPNIAFDGVSYGSLFGYNDVANIDLRQVGATGGELASLASILNFGASSTPLNIASGGNVNVGAGATATVGRSGSVTLNTGGSVTVPGGAVISGGGTVTFSTGGSATVSANATVTPGNSGVVALPSGGSVTLNTGGTITMGGGGTIAMGGGGPIKMSAGGSITLPDLGGTVTIPSSGGAYDVPAGGSVTLNSGSSITLASGTAVTVGGSGTIAMGGGGNITMGGGGTIAMGGGGTIAMGGGGTITMGGGGTIAMGGGGTIAMGGGGTIAMGGGGTITMGGGGTVTMGGGGNLSLGAGGNVTLASGGSVTLSSGGSVTVNGGGAGNIAMGGGGTIAMGGGGTITMGGGGNITLGTGGGSVNGVPQPAGYNTTVSSGGTISLSAGGSVTVNGGAGNITMGGGGTIAMGGGGTITMGGGGNITMGGGGAVTLGGAGANVTLGGGGSFSLGGGGTVTMGGGGATTNEMDYSTANSFVRPPPAATYSVAPANTVQVNWTAPAFGVVQSYTISRSVLNSDGTVDVQPVVIGTVVGANGFPPATTFTDTTPTTPPTGGSLVYTIATTLVPDTTSSTSRSSAPSPPAVLTLNQTIVLGSLPNSVTISSSTPSTLPVTAIAETNSLPNGLQVSFGTTGPCSIVSGSQSVTPVVSGAGGVSSATVTLTSTGTCTITASQAGDSTSPIGLTAYSAATPVSGAFTILPQGSTAKPQTITFGPLPSVQYGSSFSVSATSNVGATVSVSAPASGKPSCTLSNVTSVGGTTTASGTITGVGSCTIMASAPSGTGPSNSTYSTASVSQSFSIYPAVINVTAASYTIPYGQTLPTLTYALTGFVNGETAASVVTGMPSLSTTATSTSSPSIYPITVLASSLAATNYSFNPVSGTLTIQQASPTVSWSASPPPSAAYGSHFTVLATSNSTGAITYSTSGGCTNSLGVVTMTSSTTACLVTASVSAAGNFSAGSVGPTSVTANQATPTVSWSTAPPASAAYGSQFTVLATSNSTGAITYSTSGGCTNSLGVVTMTSGTTACMVSASVAAAGNYATGSVGPTSVTANQATPTVSWSTAPPASAAYGSQFTVVATSNSTGAITYSTSGGCTNSLGVVTMTSGATACMVSASVAAAGNYSIGSVGPTSVTAKLATPTVSWSTAPPASAAYGSQFTVVATSNSTGAITYSTSGGCTNSLGVVTMTSGTAACLVSASVAAAGNYATGSVGPTSVSAKLATPTVSWSTPPPASAAYGSQFTVLATSNSTGAITYSTSGGCTNSLGVVTMTSGTTACMVSASVAAAGNYATGSVGPTSVTASNGPVITVSPSSINFGAVKVESITTQTVTVSNVGSAAATISTPRVSLLQAGNSDEFVVVNLCPSSLAAGKSCTITVSFVAGAYYNTPQTATLQIMDNAPGSPQPVALSATVLEPQTITFSTSPPTSAVYNSNFTVAASASSGLAVTYTSSGSCSNAGAKYTMTSGTGTCSVILNQAGNSTYAAAPQVTKSVTATLAAQTITFATGPPTSAVYKSSFTVAASASSALGITFTSSGACSNSGATYTMTSGTGTCSVIASQAGNSDYSAAPQVTKTATATLAAQTASFSTNAPTKAAYKTSFTVAATASSGLAVSFTSSGSCTNSGATYMMTSGTGTCSVIAKQAGNSNYSAAPQVTQTVTAAYSVATLSPTSMSFGTISSGKSSTAQTATLTNTGTTPLIISSIGFTGSNLSNFTQTNTCPSSSSSLAAGANCTIKVTFNSSGKAASANLTVTDNTSAGTQTVSLSGN